MSSWRDSNGPKIGVELSWRGFADGVHQAAIGRPRQRSVNARKPPEMVDLENGAEVLVAYIHDSNLADQTIAIGVSELPSGTGDPRAVWGPSQRAEEIAFFSNQLAWLLSVGSHQPNLAAHSPGCDERDLLPIA